MTLPPAVPAQLKPRFAPTASANLIAPQIVMAKIAGPMDAADFAEKTAVTAQALKTLA